MLGNMETVKTVGMVVGISIAGIWMLTIIFRTANMVKLLEKTVSLLLQQLCSLVFTVVYLAMKIANTVEVYLLLLLDVLTGKKSSEYRISVLALSVLSIASFWSTYTGFLLLTSWWIAALLTTGIQTILLRTSLHLGEQIDLGRQMPEELQKMKYGILAATVGLGVLVTAGFIVAQADTGYAFKERCMAFLYFGGVALLLFLGIQLLRMLAKGKGNGTKSPGLTLGIYFATLAVSSFFSYQYFMDTLYQESARIQDAFLQVKMQVVSSLDEMDEKLDMTPEAELTAQIQTKLQEAGQTADSSRDSQELTELEAYMDRYQEDYEEYLDCEKEILNKEQEKKDLDAHYQEFLNGITGSGNDVGKNTNEVIAREEARIESEKAVLTDEITALKDVMSQSYFADKAKQKEYQEKESRLTELKQEQDIRGELEEAAGLLLKTGWTDEEEQRFQELEQTVISLAGDGGLSDLGTKLAAYKRYRKEREEGMQLILALHYSQNEGDLKESYQEKREKLFQAAYGIVQTYPGEEKRTEELLEMEAAYTASDMGNSRVEQNMKAFLTKRVLGIYSAILAILIDTLILFAGMTSPAAPEFFKNCTNQEREKMDNLLGRLFSKPVER